MIDALLAALIIIAIVGVIVWAITALVPLPQPFRVLVYAIGAIVCLLILLSVVRGGLPALMLLPALRI